MVAAGVVALLLAAAQPQVDEEVAPDATSSAAAPAPRGEGAAAGRRADLRLVVTGGLDGGRRGTETFFDAQLFRAGHGVPLRVMDANARAVRTDGGFFFTQDKPLTDDDLARLAATATTSRRRVSVLIGPSAIGVVPGGEVAKEAGDALRRGLAAVSLDAALEVRTLAGRAVWGLDLSPDDPLSWPDPEMPRERVPAVSGALEQDSGEPAAVFLLARQKGATARVLGVVDELLSEPDAPPTAYLDVGGALTGARHGDPATARRMRDLLLARRPVALGAGRAELAALAQDPRVLDEGPYVVAAEPTEGAQGKLRLPPGSRAVEVSGRRLLFVALGDVGGRARALLPRGARALSAGETLERAGRAAARGRADLVLGVALSSEGADAALTSSTFDGVLHLASSRLAALPAVDDIDLRGNHRARLHAGAGLVRVSSADVTEVSYWFDETGRVERLRIERHPIVDEGPEAADALAALAEREATSAGADLSRGLPARALVDARSTTWTREDLDAVSGSVARASTHAEVSLLPRAPEPLPVEGPVPFALARSWLRERARVVVIELRGSALERVYAMARGGAFAARFSLGGGDPSSGTVAERPLAPLESYRLVASREALEALEQLGVVIAVPDEALAAARPLGSLVADELASGLTALDAAALLEGAKGRAVPAFFFELTDVAVSLSMANVEGNAGLGAVRDARVQTPDNVSLGVNGRAALLYDGPLFAGGLIGTSQFSRTTLTAADGSETVQEPRDQLLVETDLRFQLPRVLGTSPAFTPLPNARLSYETEWTPNVVKGEDGADVEQPRRSELRGLLGASLRPAPWLNELRVGLILENDFAAQKQGSLEWGAEVALSGAWRLGAVQLKLDSYARGYAPDPAHDTPDDVGLVMQTIGRVELPAFFDLNVSLFADAYMLWGKLPETRGPVTSVIFGAALSYGHRSKWLPLGG